MNNRINLYLQKSAGDDERGGGLGVVGNVAAAGIAGGAGYMGYQKFKPELHAAYHDIVGTAKSQATKGIMSYAKKGIAGVAALGAGAAIGGYHLLGGSKGVGKLKTEVKGAYNEATAARNAAKVKVEPATGAAKPTPPATNGGGNPVSYMAPKTPPKTPPKTASAFKPIHYRYY